MPSSYARFVTLRPLVCSTTDAGKKTPPTPPTSEPSAALTGSEPKQEADAAAEPEQEADAAAPSSSADPHPQAKPRYASLVPPRTPRQPPTDQVCVCVCVCL